METTNLTQAIHAQYGNKVRLRVCGWGKYQGKLILLRHNGLGPNGLLWAPPGGGVQVGEGLHDALIREFKEETGLDVSVGELMGLFEFIKAPLHAVEIHFQVRVLGGELALGSDPESAGHEQILSAVGLWNDLNLSNEPLQNLHGLLAYARTVDGVLGLRGFFKQKE